VEYDAFADALVAGAKTYIDGQIAPLMQRLRELEVAAVSRKYISDGEMDLISIEVMRQITALPPAPPGPPGPAPDPAELTLLVAHEIGKAVAGLPPATEAELDPIVARHVEAAVAALPPPAPGKDADPELTAQMVAVWVEKAVARLPTPADGRTPTEAELEPIIARQVEAAVAALPPPAPGKDADPELTAQMVAAEVQKAVSALPTPADGHTPTEADLQPIVARHVEAAIAALPPPVPGKDADPLLTRQMITDEVAEAVASLPTPADGKSVSADELVPVIEKLVERSVATRPPAKDGIGLAGALIDRDGQLVLTLSDGSVRVLGAVVGKDADMAALADACLAEIAKIPRPRDGKDGLGFEDVSVIHDGERLITIRFMRGDQTKEFTITIPAIIDRGIWREGKYAKGDGVTWDGSFFVAQCDTEEKPLLHQDWRQAVKAGRPGRNTETVKYLPATVKMVSKANSADPA
jgi:hypothetical protein